MHLEHREVMTLLQIARRTLEAVLGSRSRPVYVPPRSLERLFRPCGAFVTLRSHTGRLRGCIGRLAADQPLYLVVQQMAVAAALEDPRFIADRLTIAELPYTTIEISVLSPLERVTDPLTEIVPGVHGVYVKYGDRTGCFLPKVATEMGWSTREFLENCCARKAGLPPDAWMDPAVEVYRFTATTIEEPQLYVGETGDPFGPVIVQPI